MISLSSLREAGYRVDAPLNPQEELIRAIKHHHLKLVDWWIQQGADLTIPDLKGNLPLHVAILLGQSDTVEALLVKGASPFVPNREGKTPYQLAVEKENKTVQLLLDQRPLERGSAIKNDSGQMAYKRDELTLISNIEKVAPEIDPITSEIYKIKSLLKERGLSVNGQVKPLLEDLKQPWDFYQSTKQKGVVNRLKKKIPSNADSLFHKSMNKIIGRIQETIKKISVTEKNKPVAQSLKNILAVYEKFKRDLSIIPADSKDNLLNGRTQIRGQIGYRYLDTNAEHHLIPKEKPNPYGAHHVPSYGNIHWKINPYAPGIEKAVDTLNKLISGQGSPPTALLKITSHNHSYPILASKTIQGTNLLDVMRANPDQLSKIDPANFSAMAILGILTDPLDGKPDNFMVQKENDKWILVSIDNDMSFSNVIIEEAGHYFIDVMYVLYLFPQMDEPVDTTFRTHFLNLSPEVIVIEWLKSMIHQNEIYNDLLKKKILSAAEFEKMQLPIALNPQSIHDKGLVKNLYTKLYTLQQTLQENVQATPRDLLRAVHPLLAAYYENFHARYKQNNPSDKQSLLDVFAKIYLQGNKEQRIEEMISSKRPLHSQLTVKSALKQYKHTSGEHEETRTQSPKSALEDFISTIKWEKLPAKSQKKVLDAILDTRFLHRLNFSYTHALDDATLVKLGSHFPKLSGLTILNCPTVTVNGLSGLLVKKPDVHLTLGSCAKISTQDYSFLSDNCKHLSIRFTNGQTSKVIKGSYELLHDAIQAREEAIFFFALGHVHFINEKNPEDNTALHLTVKTALHDIELAKRFASALLFAGSATDIKDAAGETPIEKTKRYCNNNSFFQSLFNILEDLQNPMNVLVAAQKLKAKWESPELYTKLWEKFLDKLPPKESFVKLFPQPFDEITHLKIPKISREEATFIKENCPLLESITVESSREELEQFLEIVKVQRIGVNNSQIGEFFNINIEPFEELYLYLNSPPKLTLKGTSVFLTTLNLSYRNIKDEGAQSLAQVLLDSSIEHLILSNNEISMVGMESLAKALPSTQIREFVLCSNEIKDSGMKALAQALPRSKVQHLNVAFAGFGDAAMEELSEALPPSPLIHLELSNNKIGADGATTLAMALPASKILYLDISNNEIGIKGAKALSDCLPSSHLLKLNLSYNQIGNNGGLAIAEIISRTQITHLDLSGNDLGDSEIEVLAKHLSHSKITHLNLSWSKIGDAGIQSLVKAIPHSQVAHLNLVGNKIGINGKSALKYFKKQNAHITMEW